MKTYELTINHPVDGLCLDRIKANSMTEACEKYYTDVWKFPQGARSNPKYNNFQILAVKELKDGD